MVRRTSKSVEFPIDGLGSPSYRPYPITTSLNQQAGTRGIAVGTSLTRRVTKAWHELARS
ncbi:MAG: hypothetical protein ACOVLE_11655 [Pirellula staleyi]